MTSSGAASASSSRVRVAVVGAGLAGLTAANALVAKRGLLLHEIAVLEAQTRVGGRVHTRPFSAALPVNVEAGAAWVHGTRGSAVAQLASNLGVELKAVSARNPWLHPASCDGFALFDAARQLDAAQVQHTWRLNALLLERLQQLATAEDSEKKRTYARKSLAQLVEMLVGERTNDSAAHDASDDALRAAVRTSADGRARVDFCVQLIEIWMGASADALQLDDFVETDLIGDDAGPHCIVPSGMERLIDGLAAPIRAAIRTNWRVQCVAYGDDVDGVRIESDDGRTVRADYVIVTAALGLLKTGALAFSPPLPRAKQAAIARSAMGQYMKVLLQFPDVFWQRDAPFFGQLRRADSSAATDADADDTLFFPLMFNYYYAKQAPILEGVLVGDTAAQASARFSDDAIVAAFFKQLQGTYGAHIPEPTAHFITRWDKDPWARGAYSCLTVDSSESDPETLRQLVGSKVLFAGEATIYKYQGALQAAYLSGLQAVEELDQLGL